MKKVENKPAEHGYTVTEYSCPVCGKKMVTEATLINTIPYVVVWCGFNIPQEDGTHCREVVGYGKDSKAAAAVIKEKFTKALEGRRKNT